MRIKELPEESGDPPSSDAPGPLDPATLQQHATATSSALQGFMGAQEQSYKQFMDGFMQLTAEDVAEFKNRQNQREANLPPRSPTSPARTSPRVPSPKSAPILTNPDSQSDLEEVVLGEGETISSRLMRPESPGRLKMGNFVDDEEGLSSDDDNDPGGYEASFMPSSFEQRSPKPRTQDSQAEASTSSNPTIPQGTRGILKPSVVPPRSTEILGSGQEASKMAPGSSVAKPSSPKPRAGPLTPGEALRSEFPDSEEIKDDTNLIDPSKIRKEFEDQDEEELKGFVCNPVLDGPNPGEVDDKEQKAKAKKRNTCLPFTVVGEGNSKENLPQQAGTTQDADSTEDTVIDAVEEFTLDEDFDYDNVVLTPKYSAEDMAFLTNCAKKGS